jgi:hypothetical protein
MHNTPQQFNTLDKELWTGKDIIYNTTFIVCILGRDPVASSIYPIYRTVIQRTLFSNIKYQPIKTVLISALKALS